MCRPGKIVITLSSKACSPDHQEAGAHCNADAQTDCLQEVFHSAGQKRTSAATTKHNGLGFM
jgi:hypothetical protein